MSGRLVFGTMGWQEKDWVGNFYPVGTTAKEMLTAYAGALHAVEVDSTFYGRPRESTVQAWRDGAPEGFRFALKVSQEVTHKKRFKDAGQSFQWFVDRARTLGAKLGPLLLQCPKNFTPSEPNRARLFEFIDAYLPGDVMIALELRDPRWYDEALFTFARSRRFALAATESEFSDLDLAAKVVDSQIAAPVEFAYLRWFSNVTCERFDRVQVDRSASLAAWVPIIEKLRAAKREVFGFVSDDYQGHAPSTVRDLLGRLGEQVPPQAGPPTLF